MQIPKDSEDIADLKRQAVIAKGDPEARPYFCEAFLGVYDDALRKKTGSYLLRQRS